MLSARVWGDTFVTQMNAGIAPMMGSGDYPGGCCADTLRKFGRDDGGSYSDVDLLTTIATVFEDVAVTDSLTGTPWAYANHAFDITTINGASVAIVDVAYKLADLGDCMVDAVVAVDLDSGKVVETADGDSYFSFYEHIGTLSTEATDGIYKIQYRSIASNKDSASAFPAFPTHWGEPPMAQTRDYGEWPGGYGFGSGTVGAWIQEKMDEDVARGHRVRSSTFMGDDEDSQQFHQNGLTRFQATDGTWVLAVTQKVHGEAVLMKCPFTYSSALGGGSILQRFGSPTTWVEGVAASTHSFGLSSSEGAITALHNIYHTVYPDGTHTMSLFVNNQGSSSVSQVYEFEVNLVPEPASGDYDDTIFTTTYSSTTLDYSENTWGGARPLGKGVWLVGRNDITAVDSSAAATAAAAVAAAEDQDQDGVIARKLLQDGPPPPPPPSSDDDGTVAVYDSFCFFTLS